MAYDLNLGIRINQLHCVQTLQQKPMFGGVAWFMQGNFVAGIYKTQLIIRVGIEATEELLNLPHVKPMNITGKVMRGWLMIDPGGFVSADALEQWINRAIYFVEQLPAKIKSVGIAGKLSNSPKIVMTTGETLSPKKAKQKNSAKQFERHRK